jgi:hypothetical protein
MARGSPRIPLVGNAKDHRRTHSPVTAAAGVAQFAPSGRAARANKTSQDFVVSAANAIRTSDDPRPSDLTSAVR